MKQNIDRYTGLNVRFGVWEMVENNQVVCCFTGHRPKSLPCGANEEHSACIEIKRQLKRMIVGLIEKKNVTHFISGAALGVDMWAMEIVLELKEQYAGITLEAAVPCATQSVKWNEKYRKKYNRLIENSDEVTCIQREYTSDCMMKRNKYMVDKSDFVLAVWNGKPSGTGSTIRYAKQRGKTVYCINTVDFTIVAI